MNPGSPATRARRAVSVPMSVSVFTFAAAAATASGITGCGDNLPPVPSEVQVVLGGTADDGSGFGPLEGDVPLIPGSQGGFHVWVKYRVTGARVGLMRVAYTARRVSDDRLILMSGRAQELGVVGDAGYWESPAAIPAFMCPTPLGVQVRDEPIRFKLEIFDLDRVLLGGAEAVTTPHCQENHDATFCIRICSG